VAAAGQGKTCRGEEDSDGGVADGEGGGGGDGRDQQGAAGVAEFAAEFGVAHGLAEPFGWGGGGQGGEALRRDESGAGADADRGEQDPGEAGERAGGRPAGGD